MGADFSKSAAIHDPIVGNKWCFSSFKPIYTDKCGIKMIYICRLVDSGKEPQFVGPVAKRAAPPLLFTKLMNASCAVSWGSPVNCHPGSLHSTATN